MNKLLLIILAFLVTLSYGQVASDYYNKPQQELFASVSQESTYVHKAGFIPCFQSVYNWANNNRAKYNFLSVSSNDSLGVVRVTTVLDCQSLTSLPTQATYNLIITSCSGALKIGFAELKTKACGVLWRISITKELIHAVAVLPDSVATSVVKVPHISRGLLDSGYLVDFDKALERARADSVHSADSIRLADSVLKIQVVEDNETAVSTVAAQLAVDSISDLVTKDSIAERGQALIIFKHQLDLKKQVSVETKLECLEFLIRNNLRSPAQIDTYLTCLSKLCSDKQDLYYAARLTVTPEQKYMCVRYFKKAQDVSSKVQAMLISTKR